MCVRDVLDFGCVCVCAACVESVLERQVNTSTHQERRSATVINRAFLSTVLYILTVYICSVQLVYGDYVSKINVGVEGAGLIPW